MSAELHAIEDKLQLRRQQLLDCVDRARCLADKAREPCPVRLRVCDDAEQILMGMEWELAQLRELANQMRPTAAAF